MSLARFTTAEPATPKQTTPAEACEMCARPVFEGHPHLVDVRDRRLLCACEPCSILFAPGGAAQGRYKAIPRRYARIDGFHLDAGAWDALAIPVGLAYVFYSSAAKKVVAFYPSPAGATESLLPLSAWADLTERFPLLHDVQDDVEALLVRRSADGSYRGYIVPIDTCYELVGIIRSTWKGFDGGDDARRELNRFFDLVEARC